MANSWITFVKKYAKDNNMKYNEALKSAGAEYKKMSSSEKMSSTEKPKRKKNTSSTRKKKM